MLIAKGHFVVFQFSQNMNEKMTAQVGKSKSLSLRVRFLGELETPKRHFEIN